MSVATPILMVLARVDLQISNMMGYSSVQTEVFVVPRLQKNLTPVVCKTLDDNALFSMVSFDQ